MITKYGYTTVGVVALVVVILLIISAFFNNNIVKYGLIIISLSFMLFTLYFFRDPERVPPQNDQAVISPADGEIIILKEIDDHKYIGEKAWKMSIFMSPLNVHVNRIPIDGKVDYFQYVEGEYLVAFHDKADERNERTEIGIMSKFGKVFFTQVAGAMARRVVCTLAKDDSVIAGNRFGMIKFGSRSDVIVPQSWMPKVKLGDKVKGGETILFELKK